MIEEILLNLLLLCCRDFCYLLPMIDKPFCNFISHSVYLYVSYFQFI